MQPEPETRIIPPRDAGAEARERPEADPPAPVGRSESEPLILRRWVGRYELIHRLAHGGMATVYLGRAKGKAGFEKIVAVKVIHPHLANEAEFVGMFLDEARIAARIHHPHVVEILDLGERDGVHFMVMEFIEGENLAALVRALKSERLPIPVILQVLADTLEGLGAAHELRDAEGQPYRLVHRDVSPHNILINLDGWAKVADFGIMKAAGKASNTKTGELRGKLAYMSPEQARGEAKVDLRTDLFAVGVIAWELLTGQRLFACETEAATLEKVIACEIPPFTEARPELEEPLREGLEELLARSLAAQREDRYASANEMLAQVKRLIRLADALESREPRDFLGEQMRRLFMARVKYARAALRHTGEHDVVPRDSPLEPTLQVARPPTGSNPNLAAPLATAAASRSELEHPSTGTHPSTAGAPATASHPQTTLAQWSMWLLLPMLGAGIAVAVMLMLGPRFGQEEPVAPPLSFGERAPSAPNTRAGGLEITAPELPEPPDRPPGTIRWWLSTTPEGASIFVDGELQGVTPTAVYVPRSEELVEVRFELEGHQPLSFSMPPANDQGFNERLNPARAPDPVPPEEESPKRPRKPNKVKTDAGSEQGAEAPDEGSKKSFVPPPDSLRDSD